MISKSHICYYYCHQSGVQYTIYPIVPLYSSITISAASSVTATDAGVVIEKMEVAKKEESECEVCDDVSFNQYGLQI